MSSPERPLPNKRKFLAAFGGLSALAATGTAAAATWQPLASIAGPYIKEIVEMAHMDQGGNTPGSKMKITRGDGSIYYIQITASTWNCNCVCDCCGL